MLGSRVVDAAKFGQAYLSKLGWNPSQGLGTSGDGRKDAIKVQQKLDMLGIGMHHQGDPNGIAWKQNHDFENLLKRLNEGREDTRPFHKAGELGDTYGEAKTEERCKGEEEKSLRMEENETGKKDKRKRKAQVTLEEGEGEKVRRLKKSKVDG